MSGITTTQSKIAEDLDSFIYVSWFSSAYLVGHSASIIYHTLTIGGSVDCDVKFCSSLCEAVRNTFFRFLKT